MYCNVTRNSNPSHVRCRNPSSPMDFSNPTQSLLPPLAENPVRGLQSFRAAFVTGWKHTMYGADIYVKIK